MFFWVVHLGGETEIPLPFIHRSPQCPGIQKCFARELRMSEGLRVKPFQL